MNVIFTSPTSFAPRPQPAWDASSLSLMLGGDGRVSSEGWSRCPCPAHGGIGNNLSLRITHDGQLLVRYFSVGCDPDAIRAAIDDVLGTKFSCPDQGIAALGPRPAHLTRGNAASIEGNADADASNAAASTADADGRRPTVSVAWTATKIKKDDPAQVREKLRRIFAATTPVTSESLVACDLTEPRGITLSVVLKTHKRQGSRRHGPAWFAQLCPNEHDRPDGRLGVAADPLQRAVREVVA